LQVIAVQADLRDPVQQIQLLKAMLNIEGYTLWAHHSMKYLRNSHNDNGKNDIRRTSMFRLRNILDGCSNNEVKSLGCEFVCMKSPLSKSPSESLEFAQRQRRFFSALRGSHHKNQPARPITARHRAHSLPVQHR
jgi:hypothetical protein